jgi:large subunit ribosomal protein L23
MATVTDPRDIILAPVISEKSYGLIDDNVYTFLVHPDSNKTQIKIAIEKIFSVKVEAVNTLNRQGKRKRTRSRIRPTEEHQTRHRDVGARQQADRPVRRTGVAEDRET